MMDPITANPLTFQLLGAAVTAWGLAILVGFGCAILDGGRRGRRRGRR